MANDLTGNPWKVDTATAVSAAASGVYFDVYDLVLTSISASGTVLVQDVAGVLKYEAAYGANIPDHIHDHFDPPIRFNGLTVPTLTSGTLKLYVRRTR